MGQRVDDGDGWGRVDDGANYQLAYLDNVASGHNTYNQVDIIL